MPAGLHIVSKRKPGKPVVHYVYAWRGGPQILRKEGGMPPTVTVELTDAAAALRKAKPTQPGVPLLVDGLPGRVALWRVAGNAISPVLAAEVIGALKDELDAESLAA